MESARRDSTAVSSQYTHCPLIAAGWWDGIVVSLHEGTSASMTVHGLIGNLRDDLGSGGTGNAKSDFSPRQQNSYVYVYFFES